MYSNYGSPQGSLYSNASRSFSASATPVHSPDRRFMSQKMQVTPGSSTVFQVPSTARSPPPTYSSPDMQPAMASSGTSPSGSSRLVTMAATPGASGLPPHPRTQSWSGSGFGSRSRSRSGSLSQYSRSYSRSSRPRSRHSSSKTSARSSFLSTYSARSLIVNAARKSTMPFTRLPAGLDQKTAGYWVLALAIFCLAASSALVATLLNRTAASQAGFDEESNIANNEPALHLREQTRLPESFEFEMHFGRRRTTKSTTLRTPPFFSVTARPRSRATPAPFPWTVTRYPSKRTVITEPTDQYPETVPGDVTAPPEPVTLTRGDFPTPENSTISGESGNVTEHVTNEVKTTEITETEERKSSEASEKTSAAHVELSSLETSAVASSSETTEATGKETEALQTTEAASTGEITSATSNDIEGLQAAKEGSYGETVKAAKKEAEGLATNEIVSPAETTRAGGTNTEAYAAGEAGRFGEITGATKNETEVLAILETVSTSKATEAGSKNLEGLATTETASSDVITAISKETKASVTTESSEKGNAKTLDFYDDNNYDMLPEAAPMP
ncbi:uncharacterized protein LOC142768818 [Rhipicephalus microplus]|uniref:uncharacterized protein LOC142768818 n=1 Tax=Rhipicephalus microplus TaxID=6941 RepID=UPI003F6BC008